MTFGFRIGVGYVWHNECTFPRPGANGQFQKLDTRQGWREQLDWPKLGL
jgi:hypothetical protein